MLEYEVQYVVIVVVVVAVAVVCKVTMRSPHIINFVNNKLQTKRLFLILL